MLSTIRVNDLPSLAAAREALRRVAAEAGLADDDLRPILNVVSEIGLYAIDSRSSGEMTLNPISRPNHGGVCLITRIPMRNEASMSGLHLLPLGGMKKLSDQFEVSQKAGEIVIHAVKWRSR